MLPMHRFTLPNLFIPTLKASLPSRPDVKQFKLDEFKLMYFFVAGSVTRLFVQYLAICPIAQKICTCKLKILPTAI